MLRRQEVKKLCLFDARLEILCILGDEGPKPDEVKEEKQATEEAALLLKAGEAVSESQERVTSVWAWASESAEIAVLCPQAWPLFLGALLTKRLPGPSSDATGRGIMQESKAQKRPREPEISPRAGHSHLR